MNAEFLFDSWQPWADPEVVAVNRLPMRSPIVAYKTMDAARAGDLATSYWRLPLNGTWRAKRWSHPSEVPTAAVQENFEVDSWQELAVPGNWTLQGLDDLPHYTNIVMPWKALPPSLPDEVATVVYRRSFVMPKSWKDRTIIVHVGGAESVHGLWVNGEFVGWGTDSRLASEYDITQFAKVGNNEIAIVVCRYSAQSYLEDQDQWWMAGLHREVFVEARSPIGIEDIRIDSGIDVNTVRSGTASGHLNLQVRIAKDSKGQPPKGFQVRWHLEDASGQQIGDARVCAVASDTSAYVFAGITATDSWSPGRMNLWSAETPNLYRVIVTLVDASGHDLETVCVRTGFRSVEVQDRSLLINGKRVIIRGVNRHDHSPVNGKAVTLDEMRADLVMMKRHNINAVRCAHYPNDPRLLDLCDDLGLYVVDEANAEAHAYNTSLWRDQRFHASWLARVSRMVVRDRNHPSVIMWSLGNEAGYGPIHDTCAAWIRAEDPSRPLHYEPAVFHTNWIDGGVNATDIVCPMYSPIDAIVAYGRDDQGTRPLIMCEFSHAMGNSNGSLADYVTAFETVPGLQGGFIWEWKDHALRQEHSGGQVRLAYGGQFGDTPNDSNFVADGLMHADLTPHPAMREVAHVHRPVAVSVQGRGAERRLIIHNRRHFTGIDDLEGKWTLLVDGAPVRVGRLNNRVAPETKKSFALPCDIPAKGEVYLRAEWFTTEATDWCGEGHLVSWDEIALTPRRTAQRQPHHAPTPATTASLDIRPSLTLWRPATDNDGMKLAPHLWPMFGQSLRRWKEQGIDSKDPESLVRHRHKQKRLADGAVLHQHSVVVPRDLADLPRIGVRFMLPESFDTIRWFGEGPHECYPDRRSSALTGIWESSPDELPYLVPQEFGLRMSCRWMEFSSASGAHDGHAIRISSIGNPLHMSALQYTPEDLFAAEEAGVLVKNNQLTVHLDIAHRGLGTASCGPDTLEQYRIAPGRYEFSYTVGWVRN